MQYGLLDKYADELPFIREIMFDVTDDTPRLIYADWLDERNVARGAFLRVDLMLSQNDASDAQQATLQARRDDLLEQIDAQWVSLLARSPIELCPQKLKFKFMCPKRWENLQPFGDDQSVRYCDQCGKSVTYCFTLSEAREKALRGQCVVIDRGVPRTQDDVILVEPNYYGELTGIIIGDEEI